MKKRILPICLTAVAAICIFALVCCTGRSDGGKGSNGDPVKYTVTFCADGGQFSDGRDTVELTVPYGEKIKDAPLPTRVEHEFLYWCLSADAGEFDFDAPIRDNVTLRARWRATVEVKIESIDGGTLVYNGARLFVDKNTTSLDLSGKVHVGDNGWELFDANKNAVPSKTISGLADGDNTYFIQVTSPLGGVVSDYYMLTVHKSYPVDIEYMFGNDRLKSVQAYTGETFTTDYLPDIDGYDFVEWQFGDGSSATSFTVAGQTKLFAAVDAKSYTVTFDVNGGKPMQQSSMTVKYGETLNLPICEREGHTLLRWTLDGERFPSGFKYNHARDITLVAEWQVNAYAVAAVGTRGGSVTGGGTYDYGTTVRLTAATDDGYTFCGWFDGDGELVSREDGISITVGLENDYTAKWIPCPVTATCDECETVFASKTALGKTYTLSTKYDSLLGHTFDGWYKNGARVSADPRYNIVLERTPATYVAKWTKSSELADFDVISTNADCKILGLTGGSSAVQITIPDFVTEIAENAFVGNLKIYKATLGSSVGRIGASAFQGCEKLVEIYNRSALPVTAGRESYGGIARYALNVYTEATGASVLSEQGDFVFINGGSPSLLAYVGSGDEIVTPDSFGGDNYEIYKYAFQGRRNLTALEIGAGVTKLGRRFIGGCSALERITVNSNSITNYYPLFEYVDYENSFELVIGGNVTVVKSYAFSPRSSSALTQYDYKKLNAVTFSDGTNTVNIENNAFAALEGLKTVTMSNNVGTIGRRAFAECGITDLTIGKGVTSIAANAFADCAKLESIAFDAVNCADLSSTVNIFDGAGCADGVSIVVGAEVTRVPAYLMSTGDGYVKVKALTVNADGVEIGNRAFKNISVSVLDLSKAKRIETEAFYGSTALKSVTLGSGLEHLGSLAFGGCTALELINYNAAECAYASTPFLGGHDGEVTVEIGSGVTGIPSNLFSGVDGLRKVMIPDGVATIGNKAFSSCRDLVRLSIGAGVTSIAQDVVDGSYRLIEVVNKSSHITVAAGSGAARYALSVYSDDSQTKLVDKNGHIFFADGNARIYCRYEGGGDTITLPDYCDGLGYDILQHAFRGSKATAITLGSGVKNIGAFAFSGGDFQTVTLNDGLLAIGNNAFNSCTDLSVIAIPDSVTSVGLNAFYNCSAAKTIYIGRGVTSLGEQAFAECHGATSVTFGADMLEGTHRYAFDRLGKSTDGTTVTIAADVSLVPNSLFEGVDVNIIAVEFETGGVEKTVGERAFYDLSKLARVEIGNSDVAVVEKEAFRYSALKLLTLPAALREIGEYAFQNETLSNRDTFFRDPKNWYAGDSSVSNKALDFDAPIGDWKAATLLCKTDTQGGYANRRWIKQQA